MRSVKTIYILFISVLFLHFNGASQSSSGNKKMDHEIRTMIKDLNMSTAIQNEFISIYKEYGRVMKNAQKSNINRWSLYLVYLRTSDDRDGKLIKILSKNQFKLFQKRQKIIDAIGRNQ